MEANQALKWPPTTDFASTTKITVLGATLGAFIYGFTTCLFIMIAHLRVVQWRQESGRRNQHAEGSIGRQRILLTAYTAVMFALVTISVCHNNYLLWNFLPASPQTPFDMRFLTDYGVGIPGAYTSVINNWMADALLIWRAYMLLEADRKVVCIPPILFLVSLLGGEIGLSLYQLLNPENVQITLTTIALGFTLSINTFGGGLIVIRLLIYRSSIGRLLGRAHVSTYATTAAIIVESTILFQLFETFFVTTFAMKSPLFNLATEIIAPAHALCSFLVIYRVLRGKAFVRSLDTVISKQLEFE